ncbi:DoxX family protein [Mycobacterium sp. SM1]|uniref:DoxX family protein n=1 Tax=Mycobacterium sp. SM1 TaxID=2816243 RepID=UPI001BCBA057|nr:DoxX family protein [Mycobacterium sp. SM1]MBS4729513.1 DoxX family protein [Mycobacterium sp. SM1]
MSALTSPKTYVALAAFQAGDAVACAIPLPYITKVLDNLRVPLGIRWILPVVKAAAALGLLSVFRFPGLARLTTAMLTLYFVLAVGAHIRARDRVLNAVPAAALLTTFAAMTVKGPAHADSSARL